MSAEEVDVDRVVGADRVLAVLAELARHPDGVGLDELAQRLHSPKPTVHRALGSLRKARFASLTARGVYALGDEFLRLAFRNFAERPDSMQIGPVLDELALRYGETAHFAVLDGAEVVYRAKTDPPRGSVRLTSEIGGRNPAYRTAVGKLLLSETITTERALVDLVGDGPLERRTARSLATVGELWAELQRTRRRGYAVDDQENEVGINCIAVPARSIPGVPMRGAVSISALAFRTPLARLVEEAETIRSIVQG